MLKSSYFCRDDDIVALPSKLLDGFAHDPLGFTTSISFCAVKEVNSYVVGGFHASECVF